MGGIYIHFKFCPSLPRSYHSKSKIIIGSVGSTPAFSEAIVRRIYLMFISNWGIRWD